MQEYCEKTVPSTSNDEATTRRVTREFFQQFPLSKLARKSDLWLNQQGAADRNRWSSGLGRTTTTPIGWDQAFDLIAAELRGLDSPDEAARLYLGAG